MELLPLRLDEFRKRSYWNDFFRSRGTHAFEWYGDYSEYKPILDRLDLRYRPLGSSSSSVQADGDVEVDREAREDKKERREKEEEKERRDGGDPEEKKERRKTRLLHVGCGNSTLAGDMAEDGYEDIVNVDFSSVVIEDMKRRYRHFSSLLHWECLNVQEGALQRRFGDEAFDVVLDKGFLDAYIAGEEAEESSASSSSSLDDRCKNEKSVKSCRQAREREAGGSREDAERLNGRKTEEEDMGDDKNEEKKRGEQEDKMKMKKKAWNYKEEAQVYLQSVLQVLKPGGVYILITLAQDYLVKELVRAFYAVDVDITIFPMPLKKVSSTQKDGRGFSSSSSSTSKLIPFLIAVKKKKEKGDAEKETRVASHADGKDEEKKKQQEKNPRLYLSNPTRCTLVAERGRASQDETFPIWELPQRIFEVNKWRFLRFAVHSFQPGSRSTVSIHRSHPSQSRGNVKNDLPLYTLTIYDRLEPHYKEDGQEKEKTSKKHSTHQENSGKKANVKTAALFIPRGRECSWLYSTPEGNQELAIQANVSRLLLVSLGLGGDEPDEAVSGSRDDSLQFHTTATLKKDFEKIKDDLSPYLADLALPGSGEVPVLIVGEENSVRAEKTRVESPYAGWIIVRDVEREEEDEEDGEDEGDEEEKKEKIEKKGRESSSSCSSMKDTKKNKRKSKKTGKKDGEIHKNKDKKNHSSSSFSSPSISSSRRNVGVYRQMIFSCNPHALQSEVKIYLSPSSDKHDERRKKREEQEKKEERNGTIGNDKDEEEEVHFAFCEPACNYHVAIAAAFAFLPETRFLQHRTETEEKGEVKDNKGDKITHDNPLVISLLGLGGGVLASFLYEFYRSIFPIQMTCVDLDPVVVQLAKQEFGFRESPPCLSVVVEDALSYLNHHVEPASQDLLIVDLNTNNDQASLTCPAEEFVQLRVLQKMKECLKPENSLLLFNLLSRSQHVKRQILELLQGLFPLVSVFSMPDDVNELVVCHQASSASSRNLENLRNLTTERLKVLLERLLKKVDESLPSDTDTPSANRHLAKRTVYWTSWADRWKPVSSSSS